MPAAKRRPGGKAAAAGLASVQHEVEEEEGAAATAAPRRRRLNNNAPPTATDNEAAAADDDDDEGPPQAPARKRARQREQRLKHRADGPAGQLPEATEDGGGLVEAGGDLDLGHIVTAAQAARLVAAFRDEEAAAARARGPIVDGESAEGGAASGLRLFALLRPVPGRWCVRTCACVAGAWILVFDAGKLSLNVSITRAGGRWRARGPTSS